MRHRRQATRTVRQQYDPTSALPANAQRFTNQLAKVDDAALDASDPDYSKYNDIKRKQPDGSMGQVNGNYQYDAIGNLISDGSEGINNITWNVYGKIQSITKTSGTISYTYDASGNRISKVANGKETWYVRDASGNVMSVYSKDATINSGHLTQNELHLYGNSRLGVLNTATDMQTTVVNSGGNVYFYRGNKFFELSNHLGNVLVTISDKKVGHDNGSGMIDYYTTDVISANDYYIFGMQMPGRKYAQSNSRYRYGFNDKENDNEIKGEGNQQDYGLRIYDGRIGKFLSVDPLSNSYPWNSVYSYAEGNPVNFIDLDGGEEPDKPEIAIELPTLPKLTIPETKGDGMYINSNGKLSSPLVNGPVNSGAYAPQMRYITQQEFEDAIPPYCTGIYMDLDGLGATIYDANGHGAHISFIKQVEAAHKVPTFSEIIDEGTRARERSKILQGLQNFKANIYTDKATPLVLKPLSTNQRITTDVSNLKAQDILDLKDRIAKGTATEQDRIHAAALIKARIDYQINEKHDPTKPLGGANASLLPANHADLWDNRTTYVGGKSDTWWSIEGKGNKSIFHQFKGDGHGTYHWAGSTSKNNVNRKGQKVKPISLSNVPASTKKKAGFGG